MYPRVVIDKKKLKNNLEIISKLVREKGNCSIMVVTKAFCADKEIVRLIAENKWVNYIADARILNIKSFCDLAHEYGKETVLLRLPMKGEIEEVVKYADVSLNSEIETIRSLDKEAKKQRKTHKVVLMIDLGDLREGIFFENEKEIIETAQEIHNMKNIKLEGIGVNLTCYGAIIPKSDNLSILVEFKNKIETKIGSNLNIVSGGNSSSIYLIEKGELPKGISNLRIGEAFLLGNDTAYGTKIEGTVDDAIICEAQLIEVKVKPSMPIGEIGKDAFGKVPQYDDKGDIKRGILAIGKQDTELDGMIPLDNGIKIIGGSSDHTVLDLTNCKKDFKLGDILKFKLDYGALLRNATSKYVDKIYVENVEIR